MDLQKQVRILQAYTAGLTVVLAALLVSGFQTQHRTLQVLDAERINIVEPDGKLRMTISNKERVPEPVVGGKTFTGARRGAKAAGLIFFNDEGDECGGLAFSGAANGKTPQADGSLMFDQFHQDQTVGISYSQSGSRRSAGLHVWDRPETPPPGGSGAHRVFVGKETDGSAGVTIADRSGKNRILLSVDDQNAAHLKFLDETGKIVYSIPPDARK